MVCGPPPPNIEDLEKVIFNFDNPLRDVKIGIVGKYTDLIESYKSLDEALNHAAVANQLKLVPIYIDAEDLEDEKNVEGALSGVQGILVPGGFGERGTEGKIRAIQFARENNKPYFGICLGMQLAIIEFARNILKIDDATSGEFETSGTPVIDYMEGQTKSGAKGASMRLGAYNCSIQEGTLAEKVYETLEISERHRHRLEVNNQFVDQLNKHGLLTSGVNKELNLVELVELINHPFFIACQYHPEFKSRPFSPHPLFSNFIVNSDKNLLE